MGCLATLCSMVGIRLVAIATMVLVAATVVCSIVNVLATDWFVSDSMNVGIASGCSERRVTDVQVGGSVANVTITFCTHFSVADLQGPVEKTVFGLLVCSVVLGLAALFNLLFALCMRLGSLTAYLVGLQCVLLLGAAVVFGAHYDFSAPYDTYVGPAYWLAMANVLLAALNTVLCNWIDAAQLRGYRRLD